MEKVLEFVKQHVKATVTVVVLGIAVTVGWANGCVVETGTTPVTEALAK